ncbi:hypothetical protein CU044_5317 [Streptomyces sp. L-9-10]|nr:hypothetical protein CU044_5317 [Streptomyces sp. L-9-10]
MAEGRSRCRQRVADVQQTGTRLARDMLPQPDRLIPQRLGAPRGQQPRHDTVDGGREMVLARHVLDDGVRVRPAHTERRHTRPTQATALRPRPGLRQQLDGVRGPVHLRRGLADVQGPRQHTVSHRHDHLDHTGDTGRGLGVADVRLDRTEPQRLALAVLAVRGQQRLRLDRVTERGAGAVCLDRVHIGRGQARARQSLADDPLLRGAVRRGQTVRGAVLVHRGTTDHRQDRVPVAAGVRQPFHQQHAGALTPAGAVGAVGERLAPSVGGEAALAAEVDEGTGGRHHGDTAGQRHRALSLAQRLHRPVQGDQRRGTRGVDGDGGPLQAQRVGDTAGRDAAGPAGAEVALDALRDGAQPRHVVVVHHAREHADRTAPYRIRVDAGPLEGFPGGLQQQSLLRVHGQCLARRDPEERRVELVGVVQETALAGVGGAGVVGVRVVQRVQVPATVAGELADGVGTVQHEPPQVLGRAHPAGEAAAHTDERDRLVGHGHGRTGGRRDDGRPRQLGADEGGERGGCRVVEDQRRGQPQLGRRVQVVAQFDGAERVEAQLPERAVGRDGMRRAVTEHRGGVRADEVEQSLLAFGLGQARQ